MGSKGNSTHAGDACTTQVSQAQLIERWRSNGREFDHLGVLVPGAKICDQFVEDLESLRLGNDQLLNLTQGAAYSGYSREHLCRMVREGKIPNSGRTNTPKIKRKDLPIKPGHLPFDAAPSTFRGTSKRDIVRSAVDSERRP